MPVSAVDFLWRKYHQDIRKPKRIENLRHFRHFSLKVLKYYEKIIIKKISYFSVNDNSIWEFLFS